jgi:hypothetical protein
MSLLAFLGPFPAQETAFLERFESTIAIRCAARFANI